MEHVQPLRRSSFPWRAAAVAALVVAAVELAALVAIEGGRLLHVHGTAAPPSAAQTGHLRTRPSTVAGRVPAGHVLPLRPRSRVSVLVLNGNGISGAAGAEATRLLRHGYRSATATDAPSHDYAASLVLYRPGWQREAQRLAHDAGARIVSPLDGRLPSGSGRAELVVILGR